MYTQKCPANRIMSDNTRVFFCYLPFLSFGYKYFKRQCAKMIISRACLQSALHTYLSHKFLAAVLSRNLQDVMDLSRSLCAYTQLLPPTLSKSDQSGLSAPSAHPHIIYSNIHCQGGQRQSWDENALSNFRENENLTKIKKIFAKFSRKLRNFCSQIFAKISLVSFSRKYKVYFRENFIPFCKEKHVKALTLKGQYHMIFVLVFKVESTPGVMFLF